MAIFYPFHSVSDENFGNFCLLFGRTCRRCSNSTCDEMVWSLLQRFTIPNL